MALFFLNQLLNLYFADRICWQCFHSHNVSLSIFENSEIVIVLYSHPPKYNKIDITISLWVTLLCGFLNSIFINFALHASIFSGILDNYINQKHLLNNSCLLIVCRIIFIQRKIWCTPWNWIPCELPEGNNLFSPFSYLFSLFVWHLASYLVFKNLISFNIVKRLI